MNKNRKEKIVDIVIILLFTLLGLFSYFRGYIDIGDDLTFHLNRFAGLANAFEERQILPKIYPYANNEFTYASSLFYCDLFLYPFAILYHFGLSAIWCYKLCVVFYTFIGNLFVYLILRNEIKNRYLSLLGSFIYLISNYHLLNIFIRNALGEIIAISFVPLVLYSIYKILVKCIDKWILLGVSFSLLAMSHVISTFLYSLFFLAMIIIFIIIHIKDKELLLKTFKSIIKGTLLALLLSAWYLLPMLEQLADQTFWLNVNPKFNYISGTKQSLIGIFNIFVLPINKTFNINECASIGLPIIIVALGAIFIKRNKYVNIVLGFCIFLYLIIIGLIPGDSLNMIQFYFRLYILIYPLMEGLVIYVLNNIKNKKVLISVISLLLVFGITNIIIANTNNVNSEYILKNNASLEEINHSKTYSLDLDYNHDELGGGEYLPYTNNTNYINNTKAINHLDNNGVFVEYGYNYERYYSSIEFSVDNSNDEVFMLPISYYKGYKAYELIDDKWINVELGYSSEYKLLTLNSNAGLHVYKVVYKGTTLQYISLVLSIISVILLLIYKHNNLRKILLKNK